MSAMGHCSENSMFHIDLEKSSSTAVYEYFSAKLADIKSPDGERLSMLDANDQDRIKRVLKYIEDGDLRRWSLPDIREFNIGLNEWRSKLKRITNPYMYDQTFSSGLDDYPRASHPSEERYLDLRCWMHLAADCMHSITELLNIPEKEYGSTDKLLSDFKSLNQMDFDDSYGAYFDFGNHTEK